MRSAEVVRRVPAGIAAKLPAAASVIAARGLDDTKIEDLAAAAGVPKATLYYYFAGKQEILAYLLQDLLHRLHHDVTTATSAPGRPDVRLRAVICAQLSIMSEQPDACRALVGDLGRAARMPEVTAMVDKAFVDPVEQLLREGEAEGSFRADPDPRGTATAIFGALSMTGLAQATEGGPWSVNEHTDRLVRLFLAGVVAPSSDHGGA
jgi:AcrR family transcriptional regulator